jgi:transposase InsO family protein
VRRLGIAQARTPFRSPRANAIAKRWVRSVRSECLDHVFIFNERHLAKVLTEYVFTGGPIVRLDNVRPAHRRHLRLIEATKLERLLQYRCLEISIMFISGPLDPLRRILAPYSGSTITAGTPSSIILF